MEVSAGSGTLLGRDAELAQALQVVTGERGGCVAVVGVAGIGKSALVREVAEHASRAGLVVRSSLGAVSEAGLPFVGLHDLIGEDVAAGVELPDNLQEALDAALLRAPAGAATDLLALNLAVLRVMEQLSVDRRLLLVLDDLPWVDAATRSAVTFVLRRLPPDRVSMLVAMRPDADGVEELTQGVVRTLAIGPLDPTSLTAAVELRAGVKVPHRVARQLHDLSGGNPLLAVELMRTGEIDQNALADLTVPERYRAILMPRLAALSPDAGRALLAAALLSRPTLGELADVVSIDGVLEAESAGVVLVQDGSVNFTHPLFAALCRDAASGGERRDLHALLAKAAHNVVERARHLGSATLLPDGDVAARIEEAAAQARDRAAIAAAAELSLQAERLTPRQDLERRTSRGCAAAELFFQIGDVVTAADVLRRLLEDLDPGPLRARGLAVLAEIVGNDTDHGAALLQEALHQPGLDPEAEDDLRAAWIGFQINLGDLPRARGLAAELEERAEASGRDELARLARYMLNFTEVAMGTPPAQSRAWRQMIAESPAYGLSYYHPDLLQAWEAMSREDHERALELIEGLMERARLAGNIGLWAHFANHRGQMLLRRGEIGPAGDIHDEVYRILADGRHDEAWLSFRALDLAWQGRLDEACTDASTALTMAERHHNRLFEATSHLALGFVELSAGRPTAAAAHYDIINAELNAMGWRHPSIVAWQGDAVEALVGAGRRADATAIVEELEEMGARFELATSMALAGRCRALLLEDEGDLDAALGALDESLRLSEPLGIPLEHARTLLVRGVVQRRRRQKALSRDDLTHARDLFATCGAVVWADRAARELERSAAVAAGSELTTSERAVAELAAAGVPNREIAGRLYISEKTVEAVLTRVYRKLSVRSRTELARHPDLEHSAVQ